MYLFRGKENFENLNVEEGAYTVRKTVKDFSSQNRCECYQEVKLNEMKTTKRKRNIVKYDISVSNSHRTEYI